MMTLQTKALSRRAPVFYEERTESTNTDLKQLATEGAESGTVLIAGSQTEGRGRMGRSFCSPEGGLYLSLLLRFPEPDDRLLCSTAIAAIAAARVLEQKCGVSPEIKWPNDLLLNGKKLCGILTEAMSYSRDISIIIGIGLNLNTERFPKELSDICCSLYGETGEKTDLMEFAEALIAELDRCLQGLPEIDPALPAEYRRRCGTIGKQLKDGGTAMDTGEDFSLLVRLPDGTETRRYFGEIQTV